MSNFLQPPSDDRRSQSRSLSPETTSSGILRPVPRVSFVQPGPSQPRRSVSKSAFDVGGPRSTRARLEERVAHVQKRSSVFVGLSAAARAPSEDAPPLSSEPLASTDDDLPSDGHSASRKRPSSEEGDEDTVVGLSAETPARKRRRAPTPHSTAQSDSAPGSSVETHHSRRGLSETTPEIPEANSDLISPKTEPVAFKVPSVTTPQTVRTLVGERQATGVTSFHLREDTPQEEDIMGIDRDGSTDSLQQPVLESVSFLNTPRTTAPAGASSPNTTLDDRASDYDYNEEERILAGLDDDSGVDEIDEESQYVSAHASRLGAEKTSLANQSTTPFRARRVLRDNALYTWQEGPVSIEPQPRNALRSVATEPLLSEDEPLSADATSTERTLDNLNESMFEDVRRVHTVFPGFFKALFFGALLVLSLGLFFWFESRLHTTWRSGTTSPAEYDSLLPDFEPLPVSDTSDEAVLSQEHLVRRLNTLEHAFSSNIKASHRLREELIASKRHQAELERHIFSGLSQELDDRIFSAISKRIESDSNSALVSKGYLAYQLVNEVEQLEQTFHSNLTHIANAVKAAVLRDIGDLKNHNAERGTSHLSDLEDPTSQAIIHRMISEALLQYHNDVTSTVDFASYLAGARIIPSLTSPTFSKVVTLKNTTRPFFLSWLPSSKESVKVQGNEPATLLHASHSPGTCWAFGGEKGQAGIILSRTVVPHEIILEHIPKSLTPEKQVLSAPRKFQVWGLIDREDDDTSLLRKIKAYNHKSNKRTSPPPTVKDRTDIVSVGHYEALGAVELKGNHILLSKGSYDPDLPSSIQAFPVNDVVRELKIPVSVVILQITSNHGHPEHTCVYRLRVGGEAVN